MELIAVGERTYYIKDPTNIGIYKIDDERVYLIDAGNDSDAGKKILKLLAEKGWKVEGVISTHSNADHIGGNLSIQKRTGSPILTYGIESSFTEYPILEPSFLYGGYPFKELRNKFLLAKPSTTVPLQENLPQGLDYFELHGHFFDMIGIHTSDDVYFLGDSLFSEETIKKYHVFFIYDVKEFLNTLDYLSTLKGKVFIPSHNEAVDDISHLIELNRKAVVEISKLIHNYVSTPRTFEEILKHLFDHYAIMMNENQYVLVGSTVRSYLSYLKDEGKLTYYFEDNHMYWSQNASL